MEEDISLRKLADEVANLDIENILVHVTRRGKNLVLAPEVAGLFQPDSNGRLRPIINTSGEITEVSAADIATRTRSMWYQLAGGNPLCFHADGISATVDEWHPGIPVAITADGTGGVGAAVEVIAAHATEKWDAEFTVQVSVSGLHQLDFIENTAGAGVTIPDYHTAPPDVFLVAGFPYVYRLMNVTANKNLGVNAGAAGMFPNNSVMNITPMYRNVGV